MSRRRRPPSVRAPRPRSFVATTREVVVAVVVVVGAGAMLAFDATAEDDRLHVQPAASSVVIPAAPVPAAPVPATASAASDATATGLAARDVARVAEAEAAAAATAAAAAQRDAMWERLADCESGRWDRERRPIAGTARWDYGLSASEDGFFQGGLQFHPATWDEFRDADMPDHAGHASRDQQIAIAERVLDGQGWRAWPVCSRKLGFR